MSNINMPNDFKYRFAQEMRRMRLESGYPTVDALAEAANIPVWEIMVLELGDFRNWGLVFKLARFYKKKLKIEFV